MTTHTVSIPIKAIYISANHIYRSLDICRPVAATPSTVNITCYRYTCT
ncbi:hypothetical protein BMS3Abin01_00791 [bacterium BMS3Abin01]|nr:hypothetical protein BMS3Abin01_00791 [bacterium BMS3Abin01]